LKKAFSVTGIANDARKIEKHFKEDTPHATTGYLLAYSEGYGINRRNLLEKRFVTTFPNKLGSLWHLVTWFIGADDAKWEAKGLDAAWAIALYRFSGLSK
jgi:hypothetical protein